MRMYQTIYIIHIMLESLTRRIGGILQNQHGSFDIKYLMIHHNVLFIRLIIIIIIAVIVSIISYPQKLKLLIQSSFL